MLISVTVISCGNRNMDKIGRIDPEIMTKDVIDETTENIVKFKPIPIERENGFYFAIDYNNNISSEDIKLEETPSLSSEDILEVKKVINENNNTPEIRIVFTPDGKIKLAQVTKNNIGKHLAIVIANQIVSIPLINCEIPGGVITLGDFSEKEIDNMVESLKNK
jgi:preprotein translocase subunit SecD